MTRVCNVVGVGWESKLHSQHKRCPLQGKTSKDNKPSDLDSLSNIQMFLPKHPHQWTKEGDLFPTIIIQFNAWNSPLQTWCVNQWPLNKVMVEHTESGKLAPTTIDNLISQALNAPISWKTTISTLALSLKNLFVNNRYSWFCWLMNSSEFTGWHNTSAPTLWIGAEAWVIYSVVRDSIGSSDDKGLSVQGVVFRPHNGDDVRTRFPH